MKYTNAFWEAYDTAQKNLKQDIEFNRLEAELAVAVNSVTDSAVLEKVMEIMDLQATMTAHEIWKLK